MSQAKIDALLKYFEDLSISGIYSIIVTLIVNWQIEDTKNLKKKIREVPLSPSQIYLREPVLFFIILSGQHFFRA